MEQNTQTKTQNKGGGTFIKGALVLGVASLIVKLIGAFFKIPLVGLIGDLGMGYFNVAYQIYTFMFIVATAGFPIAISKMVAESIAVGKPKEAKRVFHTSITLLSVIGLIGSVILFMFAKQLANMVNIPYAELGIKAIAPAVFFVAMASTLRGYFQGKQNMFPTAFSEVIEATGKMAIGLILALLFVRMTVNPDLGKSFDFITRQIESSTLQTVYASTGAIFGVTIGTFLSFLLLAIIYICYAVSKKRHMNKMTPIRTIDEKIRSRKTILKELVLIAIPITIGASVSSLTTLIDMSTISTRLVVNPEVMDKYLFMFQEGTDFFNKALAEGWDIATINAQKAATLYGMYTGKALTMFNLPLTLIVALGMSVVPAISGAMAKREPLQARRVTESAIRIALLFGIPCAIGLSVFSSGVLNLLFSDDNAHVVLSILSIAIIPVSIVTVTNAILQSYNKVYYPVINMIIGGLVKVVFNYIAIPYLGIDGAPVGTFLCYLIIAVLNIVQIVRVSGMKFGIFDFLIKPLVASLVMGICGYGLIMILPSSRIFTILELMICVLVYGIMLFVVRAVKREDVLNLPKGEKLVEILEKFKLMK